MKRRQVLGAGAAALFATLVGGRRREASAEDRAPADALVVLWLNGGPSHVDTFDPKRGGPFKAIATRAPAIELCEHLPLLAERAERVALVRGLSTKEGSHERARQLGHTGYVPNPTAAYPSLGAWVSHELGASGELPAFVSLGGPSAGAGFLGVAHAPFVVREPGARPDHVGYGFGVDGARFDRRLAALDFLEQRFTRATDDEAPDTRAEVRGRAVRMMRSPALAAFDASAEPAAVRAAYGDTPFGRGCLTARRLIEAGVRVVEVTLDGWDTHEDNFGRTKTLMGALDPALARLLSELEERDRLRRTVILCMGEFGRSPAVNDREGRDHHPQAWSALLAGGGLRGGAVHGATDERGEKVVSGKCSVADLFATVARQLGLDPQKTVQSPGGRPVALTDGGSALF